MKQDTDAAEREIPVKDTPETETIEGDGDEGVATEAPTTQVVVMTQKADGQLSVSSQPQLGLDAMLGMLIRIVRGLGG